MLSSILIANRGEIACRIARTAKRMSLRTISVYSEADMNALHTRLCDEAYPIGPASARESYLSIEKLIAVAKAARADCIHPGYGFLSEKAEFAEACAQAGIAFIGPSPDAIRAMGLKDRAKALMEQAGVPVVPGYHGDQQDPKLLKRKAYEIGYPVLIKAVAGGGGKGMRRVDRHVDFDEALESAMRESFSAFGDNRVLIEKYIASPRHIEIQILADCHGATLHLGERDCSLQRRHQKVMEEAPAPGMTAELRDRMGRVAVAAARAVNYSGAGTIEFIADSSQGLRDDAFWFMEMNTRLQVEHPVTEALTGLDLVEWQIRIAAGEALTIPQAAVKLEGHAIEARVYAEDPERNFLPSGGKLVALQFPEREGVRTDNGVETGDDVSAFYDPMIAKMIAHGRSRAEAIDRLSGALEASVIAGPRTNLAFLTNLCRAPEFRRGGCDTGFIDRNLEQLGAAPHEIDRAAVASAATHLQRQEMARIAANVDQPHSPWQAEDGYRLVGRAENAVPVVADGRSMIADIHYFANGPIATVEGIKPDPRAALIEADEAIYVLRNGRPTVVRRRDFSDADFARDDGDGVLRAPMHGRVLALFVEQGQDVVKGQRVAVIEAMKMEHALIAPHDGTVTEIAVEIGKQVAENEKLAVIFAVEAEKE